MIVSIHIPKTAGTSFRVALEQTFGDRLLLDYDDRPLSTKPEQVERRRGAARVVEERPGELLANYDAVHGHFIADKYRPLATDARYAAFFREPGARLVSHFKQWRRQASPENLLGWKVHTGEVGLRELASDPLIGSLYRHFLGDVAVEELAFVGLTDAYERSLALFEAVFGYALPALRENLTEPDGSPDGASGDADFDKALLARDHDVYDQARRRFEALCAEYGV